MQDDGRGGQHAQYRLDKKRGGDQDAIDKIVQRASDEDQHAPLACLVTIVAGMVVMPVAFVMMAMAQQRDLFKHEEPDDGRQHAGEKRVRREAGLGRLRQQMQKGNREQHPHRKADHMVKIPGEYPVGQPMRDSQGKQPPGDRRQNDPDQQHVSAPAPSLPPSRPRRPTAPSDAPHRTSAREGFPGLRRSHRLEHRARVRRAPA